MRVPVIYYQIDQRLVWNVASGLSAAELYLLKRKKWLGLNFYYTVI